MQQTLEMLPGVTLRCMQDSRFKQSAMSIQLLRPMDAERMAKIARPTTVSTSITAISRPHSSEMVAKMMSESAAK